MFSVHNIKDVALDHESSLFTLRLLFTQQPEVLLWYVEELGCELATTPWVREDEQSVSDDRFHISVILQVTEAFILQLRVTGDSHRRYH